MKLFEIQSSNEDKFRDLVKNLKRMGIKGSPNVSNVDGKPRSLFIVDENMFRKGKSFRDEIEKILNANGYEIQSSYGAFTLWRNIELDFDLQSERSSIFRVPPSGAFTMEYGSSFRKNGVKVTSVLSSQEPDE